MGWARGLPATDPAAMLAAAMMKSRTPVVASTSFASLADEAKKAKEEPHATTTPPASTSSASLADEAKKAKEEPHASTTTPSEQKQRVPVPALTGTSAKPVSEEHKGPSFNGEEQAMLELLKKGHTCMHTYIHTYL